MTVGWRLQEQEDSVRKLSCSDLICRLGHSWNEDGQRKRGRTRLRWAWTEKCFKNVILAGHKPWFQTVRVQFRKRWQSRLYQGYECEGVVVDILGDSTGVAGGILQRHGSGHVSKVTHHYMWFSYHSHNLAYKSTMAHKDNSTQYAQTSHMNTLDNSLHFCSDLSEEALFCSSERQNKS